MAFMRGPAGGAAWDPFSLTSSTAKALSAVGAAATAFVGPTEVGFKAAPAPTAVGELVAVAVEP